MKEYEFHGFTGKRRVIYYGWQYDFDESRLKPNEPIPNFLRQLRERAASFAGLAVDDLAQAQAIEYKSDVAIGWHRDRGVFGDVTGISLLSACNFRFGSKSGSSWERYSFTFPPEIIFAVITDIAHRVDWVVEPVELVRLLDGPAKLGTKWERNADRLGKKLVILNTCNIYEKNRKFGWKSEAQQFTV